MTEFSDDDREGIISKLETVKYNNRKGYCPLDYFGVARIIKIILTVYAK